MVDSISSLEGVTFAVVDVETTGLQAGLGDRICEIAVVRGRAGGVLENFTTLINPERSISPGANRVNRISNTMVKRAPLLADVAPELRRLMSDAVLVAHNAAFDVGFLRKELPVDIEGNNGLPALTVDTLQIARRSYRFTSNRLADIGDALRLMGKDPSHRALSDAITTWRLLNWFITDLRDRGLALDSLGELMALQGALDLAPQRFHTPDAPPSMVPPVLAEALSIGADVWMRYAGSDGRRTERVVAPKRVALDREVLYLVAFCRLRQEERAFRVDRILKMELAD